MRTSNSREWTKRGPITRGGRGSSFTSERRSGIHDGVTPRGGGHERAWVRRGDERGVGKRERGGDRSVFAVRSDQTRSRPLGRGEKREEGPCVRGRVNEGNGIG